METKHHNSSGWNSHFDVSLKRKILEDYRHSDRWTDKLEPVDFIQHLYSAFDFVRKNFVLPATIKGLSDGQKHVLLYYLSRLIESFISFSPEAYDIRLDNLNFDILLEYKRLDDTLYPPPVIDFVPAPGVSISLPKIAQVNLDIAHLTDLGEITTCLLEHKKKLQDEGYDDSSHPAHDEKYANQVENLLSHYEHKLNLELKLKALASGSIPAQPGVLSVKESKPGVGRFSPSEKFSIAVGKLTLKKIALWHFYMSKPITADNAGRVALKFGFQPGRKLYHDFSHFSSRANRIGQPHPFTKKRIKNKVELFQSVFGLLPKEKRGVAVDELTIIKRHLSSF